MARKTRAELMVENWNLKHPVGTPVSLRKDSGDVVQTITCSEAYITNSGHAAVSLKGSEATTFWNEQQQLKRIDSRTNISS